MIDHNHILDVESLLKTMRTITSPKLHSEIARVIRREMLQYVPRKESPPKLVTPVYQNVDFSEFKSLIVAFHKHITSVKKGEKSQCTASHYTLFDMYNKIALIRELRAFSEDMYLQKIGLLPAKCIIEQTFADLIQD